MRTYHTLLIVVILALLGTLGYSAEGFGMSPGTLTQLASTRAEEPVYIVNGGRGRYDAGNTVLITILIVGFMMFLFGLSVRR